MEIPKISVVMTAYGVADFIQQACESVLNSSYKDLELIVVDDCSTDGTADVLAKIEDPRFKVVRNEVNIGAGASRQVGIDHAIGEFVILIDGDDFIGEDFLEALVKRQEETGCPIVSGGMTFYDDEKGELGTYDFQDDEWEAFEDVTRLWGKRLLFLNNMIVKRDLLVKSGYCPRRYIEDAQVRFMIMYYGKRIAYSSNCGYYYRRREGSLTNSASKVKDAIYRALCAMDVLKFFQDKEKKWSDIFGMPLFVDAVNNLKRQRPTKEQIEPYKEDFLELMLFIMNV